MAAAGFIELVRKWESSDDLILRTYSLVGLRADVDFMLWRIAFDPLFRRLPVDEQRMAAAAFIDLVRKWECLDEVILRTY